MALTISQIAAVSYPAVLNEMRKAENQWAENAVLHEMEKQGMIKKQSLGSTIDVTLDYRRNPGAEILETDMSEVSLTKTEVLTAASYAIGEFSVPVTWSKKDEAQNPTQSQKVSLVKSLLENGITSHDDLVEEQIFSATATHGVQCAVTLMSSDGLGTIGGINSTTDTFWRSNTSSYLSDGSDIEAEFTEVYNECAKGSGSALAPTLMFGGSDPHALLESALVPYQRWGDSQTFKAGAKVLIFKTARFVFSHYGSTTVFFVNPKNFQLVFSREFYRDKGETQEIDNANAFTFKIYSAGQLVTSNRSRLGASAQA
jgi:hypothetical protein